MRRPGFPLLLTVAGLIHAGSVAAGPHPGVVDSLIPLRVLEPRDRAASIRLTPHALILDPIGKLWVLDRSRARILRMDPADGTGLSFSIEGAISGGTSLAADLAASGTFLYLLDPTGPRLVLLDLDGHPRGQVDLAEELDRAGSGGFLASRVIVGRSGDLWLVETRSGRIQHFDRRGRYLDAPLDALAGTERPRRIADVALTPDDGLLILDATRPALLPILANGVPRAAQMIEGSIIEPVSMAVDEDGNRYILEGTGRVRILDPEGIVLWDGTPAGEKPSGPHRAVVTGERVLMRVDPARGTIRQWQCLPHEPRDGSR